MTDDARHDEVVSGDLYSIEQLAKDYSRYLSTNSAKERQQFYDSIEEMLTKLDEFGGLVDMIRSDTGLCLNKTLPEIETKCEEMKQIFARIDKLEAFVTMVRQNVAVMEERVNRAENDLGSFSGIKKMFSSLVAPRKSQGSKPLNFDPPDIFVTANYLKPASGTGEPASHSGAAISEQQQHQPEQQRQRQQQTIGDDT